MAKILSISDNTHFRLNLEAQKHKTAIAGHLFPWDQVARVASSPTAIVGYFILLLMGCARLP